MVLLVIFWVILYRSAPETKGRSTAYITNQFKMLHEKMIPVPNNYQVIT